MERLQRPGLAKSSSGMDNLFSELLCSVTTIHIAHLGQKGPGSYAAHKALGNYYEDVAEFIDSAVEAYQGVTGKLVNFPDKMSITRCTSAEECCAYLKGLHAAINKEQQNCPYSEVVNVLDEIKALIDSTCYKLTFLK